MYAMLDGHYQQEKGEKSISQIMDYDLQANVNARKKCIKLSRRFRFGRSFSPQYVCVCVCAYIFGAHCVHIEMTV